MMGNNAFIDWELLYDILITNPIPWGGGYLKGHRVFLTEEQKKHSTNSILQWADKVYLKIETIQQIRKAQKNALIIKIKTDVQRGMDAWM